MPPPAQQRTGGLGQPADLGPRFLARLIDYVLLAIVNGIIGAVIVAAIVGTSPGAFSTFGMGTGATWAAGAVSTLISTVITLGYFTLMEARSGQTVGKMILKLQTRGPDGATPTTEQALRRNAFTAIGIIGIIPYIGFVGGLLSLAAVIMIAVTINNDATTRHGWHDNFAGGTTVVKIG